MNHYFLNNITLFSLTYFQLGHVIVPDYYFTNYIILIKLKKGQDIHTKNYHMTIIQGIILLTDKVTANF